MSGPQPAAPAPGWPGDVGARAFNWKKHIKDLTEYWGGLAELKLPVKELYKLKWRFGNEDYDSFVETKTRVWPDIGGAFLKKLYAREKNRAHSASKPDAWKLIEQRIKYLMCMVKKRG